jgi:hypothetical protein
MPDHPIDNAKKLQKLGERIRDGFSKENPVPDKSLETVRQTIREQWEKDRQIKARPPPPPVRSKNRQPEDPDQAR